MIKVFASFVAGIAVGIASASASTHPPMKVGEAHAVSRSAAPTPYSEMHSAIPTPAVTEAHPPTF